MTVRRVDIFTAGRRTAGRWRDGGFRRVDLEAWSRFHYQNGFATFCPRKKNPSGRYPDDLKNPDTLPRGFQDSGRVNKDYIGFPFGQHQEHYGNITGTFKNRES